MKTTFGRTFVTVTAVLLLALCTVGVLLWALLSNYLTKSAFSRLEQSASVISQLVAAYSADGKAPGREFILNLDVAASVSDVDAVICDKDGIIILCSEDPLGCSHQGMSIGAEYLGRIRSSGATRDTGAISGLFEDPRFVYATVMEADGQPLGYLLVSVSTAHTQNVLQWLRDIFIFLSVMVVLVAVTIASIYLTRQTKPLQVMAKTARAFGHGDLNARVEMKDNYTQEVEELALAFNNMADSLQKSEYQRQEFVANVSHELKTPMTTIGGYIDGILDGTIPPEKSRHYMQIVSDETKRLSRLVRSMLDISQLQTDGVIPPEKRSRFDLSETVGQVLLAFEPRITGKRLQVEVSLPLRPVYTNANRDYVTQVVYNLVDNAVKFCPEGGVLGIRIVEGGAKAFVSVYNDGKTIPPEELPLVFDRFHKLDKSRSENRDGWGLGLYIVKTIVCAHGENISVTSHDGRTEFTFTMPIVI